MSLYTLFIVFYSTFPRGLLNLASQEPGILDNSGPQGSTARKRQHSHPAKLPASVNVISSDKSCFPLCTFRRRQYLLLGSLSILDGHDGWLACGGGLDEGRALQRRIVLN